MGSYNPAIPCCCNKGGQNLCCLAVTLEQSCETAIIDEENCTAASGPVQTLTYFKQIKTCASSYEECNCEILSTPENTGGFGQEGGVGGFGQLPPGTRVVDCFATYYSDIKCDSPEAAEACTGGDTVCTKYKCGPCQPVKDGCVIVSPGTPCPSIPDCPPDPCCEPPPTQLCCCRVIDGGCIVSANCTPCTEETSSGTGASGEICTFVSDCEGCNLDTGFHITTLCCPSCYYLDTDGDNVVDVYRNECVYYGTDPQLTTCCNDCRTYDPVTGDITCESEACILPCGSGVSPPTMCPCPMAPTGYKCYALSAQTTFKYGTVNNSAEGNFMSGMIYDPATKTYKQNRLFLFGYGYDKL